MRSRMRYETPSQPSTQHRTNTDGLTGQARLTRPTASSPSTSTPCPHLLTLIVHHTCPRNPFAHRPSPCHPWRAPYPHPTYLTTQSRPHNLLTCCPSPQSPHQTMTWHPTHVPPQRVHSLTAPLPPTCQPPPPPLRLAILLHAHSPRCPNAPSPCSMMM